MTDEYLKGIAARASAEHTAAFQTGGQTFQRKRTEQTDKDDEMFARLMAACRGVPHLATCMYETLKAAKLRIVPDDQ